MENITDSSPTTVEPFFYARVLDKKKIFIGSDTRVIKDRAFSECVMYDKDENMTTKEGVLEEIHIPYGIDLYSGATALIGVDYNYLKTSIPSKIQDRFTFFVYDPKVLIEGKPKYLFSISYPILATHTFSSDDYPKILRGEFDPTCSQDGRIITTYNGFEFNFSKVDDEVVTKQSVYKPVPSSNVRIIKRISSISDVVEEYAYDGVHDKREIVISRFTKEIRDRAFSRCVIYDQEGKDLSRLGLLEEIHIPYGVKMAPDATALIGEDINYQITGIPSKISDRLTFFVYDPDYYLDGKRKILFSISYPILATHIFSLSDYPKILRGEFDPTESKDGRIITTYNNFKFPSQTKSSVVNGWNESGSTYVADGLHKVKEKGKVIPFPVKNN